MSKEQLPPNFPGSQPGDEGNDPETEGLPPQVKLPDRQSYRRGQIWARLIVCLAGLALLTVIYFTMNPADRTLVLICIVLVAAAAVVQVVRYVADR
jgi:hypothetical protein